MRAADFRKTPVLSPAALRLGPNGQINGANGSTRCDSPGLTLCRGLRMEASMPIEHKESRNVWRRYRFAA
jgi:hypothetical protein